MTGVSGGDGVWMVTKCSEIIHSLAQNEIEHGIEMNRTVRNAITYTPPDTIENWKLH